MKPIKVTEQLSNGSEKNKVLFKTKVMLKHLKYRQKEMLPFTRVPWMPISVSSAGVYLWVALPLVILAEARNPGSCCLKKFASCLCKPLLTQ